MLELAIGLGVGLGSTLTAVILFFVLLRSSGARGDRADARCAELGVDLKAMTAARDHEAERADVLEQNQGELLKENADLQTSNKKVEAELASTKANHDDLVRVLSNEPGSLSPAIHGALERLRTQMSAAGTSTPADPGRGEGRPVHAGDELEPP